MIWKLWRIITFFAQILPCIAIYCFCVSWMTKYSNISEVVSKQNAALDLAQWKMWVKVTLGKTQSHLDLKLPTWGFEAQVSGWGRGGEKHRSQVTTRDATFWFLCLLWRTLANFGVVFSQICCKEDWPQVLQKNIGVFSLRSQLAQEGNSSEEDSTWWRDNWNCNPLEDLPVRFTKRFPSRTLRRKFGF